MRAVRAVLKILRARTRAVHMRVLDRARPRAHRALKARDTTLDSKPRNDDPRTPKQRREAR